MSDHDYVFVEIAGTGIGWAERTARDKQGKPITFKSSDKSDEVRLLVEIWKSVQRQQKEKP